MNDSDFPIGSWTGSAVGNGVDPGYHHVTRRIEPGPPLTLPDAYLKWYAIHPHDLTIDPAADTLARAFLADEAAAGRLAISGDLGFVIHHRCGERLHLLLVCTWRVNNEMWETIYAREDDTFALMPQTTHRAAFCVWEFGAIAHEHRAWTAFLRSDRDAAAKRAYAETQVTATL